VDSWWLLTVVAKTRQAAAVVLLGTGRKCSVCKRVVGAGRARIFDAGLARRERSHIMQCFGGLTAPISFLVVLQEVPCSV
jgi:hypothetical protein